MGEESPGVEALQEFLDAFNRHDIEAIMEFIAEDCVFETPRGPDPWGTRMVGKAEVRKGFEARPGRSWSEPAMTRVRGQAPQ